MKIDGINPLLPHEMPGIKKNIHNQKDVPTFKETLSTFLTDVNDSQKKAGEAQAKLISGQTQNVHQVMAASEEATVSFNMLMELRNKSLDAYQEIMRIKL